MRATFEKILPDPQRSFRVLNIREKRFSAPWHFHPELELTLILAGRGRRFVGDSIEPFAEGDLILVGPNLPHFWQSARSGRGDAHAVVVQFMADFLGSDLWGRPELAPVGNLLRRAGRGLHYPTGRSPDLVANLATLPGRAGLPGLTSLLGVLDRLAGLRGRPLAGSTYAPLLDSRAGDRMARVHAFLSAHHARQLTLGQIAKVAAMTPPAFSRWFKRSMGRNISDYLNDLRIDHAARLLRETPAGIAHIAAAAGYETLSNFNRRFRERHELSPREYRRVDLTAAPVIASRR